MYSPVLLYINYLSDGIICSFALHVDDTTSKQACEYVVSELEFDLREAFNWGRKRFFVLNVLKTHLFSIDPSSKFVPTDGSPLNEKLCCKILWFFFL